MNSKERVLAAVRRKEYDRIPRFFWVGEGAAANLKREKGIEAHEMDSFFGNDVLQCWLSINKQMTTPCAPGERFVDEWGITWERSGYYNAPVIHPLAGLSAQQMAEYPFPDPYSPERYRDFHALISQYGKTHFIGADVSGTLFEPAYHLRGMQELMMDMALNNDEADILLDKLCDFSLKTSVAAIRRGADWVWLGDDMGTQSSMLISADMWRQYFKPRMQKIIDAIRAESKEAVIAYHSCGSIYPIIGDLAEIGIQVLNPIQESAAGMDQRQIKAEYGDRLTLMCGLDTQTLLLQATPDKVYSQMQETARELSRGGGYIAAVSHTIQHDVPVENLLAMMDALDHL